MAAKEGDAELAFHRYPSPTWDPHWDITFQMFAKVLVTGDPELFEAGQFTNSGCFSRMGGEVGFSENGEVSPISPEDIDSPISPISPLSFLLASRH
ncbi:hypothetical protein MKQ70_08490 [Chitinophaga sedimenti]|uniref:hypothetical protein n=1 Tax=Chitinophaga sedimenti TaxID=2033606 RepID=UPI0020058D8A|nr:hypothetical protein [Chitinophaga sedimenti]MCK7555044.1 hypothetical protein [Chitinophaga sedimenti]